MFKKPKHSDSALKFFVESRMKHLEKALEELRKIPNNMAVDTQILIYENELDTLSGIKLICERRKYY